MKKITLCDIAKRCGVSATVVSAVLNGRGQRSRCSAEKQQEIRRTAEEMNYRPNIFARSMVTRSVPVVALMLRLDNSNVAYGSRYFAESAAGVSRVLLDNGLETLLVFYKTQEEQIARFSDLVSKGVIGGMIGNVEYSHNARFIKLLQESGLPYVLSGETEIPAVSVMPEPLFASQNSLYTEARERYGAEKIFIHQAELGRDVLFPYSSVPGYSRFHYPSIIPVPELTADPRNMIVSQGYEFYQYLNKRMKIASPLVCERKEFEFLIPDDVPRLISEESPSSITEAAELLVRWMIGGEKPACEVHYIPHKGKSILKWSR